MSHGAAPVVDLVVIFAGVDMMVANLHLHLMSVYKTASSYQADVTERDSLDFGLCNSNEVLASGNLTNLKRLPVLIH